MNWENAAGEKREVKEETLHLFFLLSSTLILIGW